MDLTRRKLLIQALAFSGVPSAALSASENDPTIAASIARCAHVAFRSEVPKLVKERAAWTLLDNLGVIFNSLQDPATNREAAILINRTGGPTAKVPFVGRKGPIELVASSNAFLIHSAEIDDGDLRSQIRASAVPMSVALALASCLKLSAEDFLKLIAIGYTIQARLALAAGPIQGRGWMASAWWGPPAAAVMTSLALGLNEQETASAIALAASGVSGTFQYFYDQTEEKRLIVARAARVGVESAFLARSGMQSARRVFEGQAGLYSILGVNSPKPFFFENKFSELDGILFVQPKFIAASHSIIPLIDGLTAAGYPAEKRIPRRFVVRGGRGWARVLEDKINDFKCPSTAIGGMTSPNIVISRYLMGKDLYPASFKNELCADPTVLTLARTARFEKTENDEFSINVDLGDNTYFHANALLPNIDEPVPIQKEKRLKKFSYLTQNMDAGTLREIIKLSKESDYETHIRNCLQTLFS